MHTELVTMSVSNPLTGIMRCDYIAEGVINAAKELSLTVPLIVRLKCTKEAEAKERKVSRLRAQGLHERPCGRAASCALIC